MTEWMCMVPMTPPDLTCDYEACELQCPYREVREKLEDTKKWIKDTREWAIGRYGIIHLLDELDDVLEVK